MNILFAKHWQVFLITYGIQLGAPILIGFSQTLQPFLPKIELLLVFILIISLFWWLWSVSNVLQNFIDPSMRVSTRLFKIAFVLPIVYLSIASVYFSAVGTMPLDEPWIMIPHIISIFCFLYVMAFAAKIIKIAETKRELTVNEYFTEIVLIFFFPVSAQNKFNCEAQLKTTKVSKIWIHAILINHLPK